MIALLAGDCLDVLRRLPDGYVQMCVTSPPYYGLRNYDCDGQIGLEKSPDEYVARLVGVFREVRRVLADDGTLWLNLGDSYAGGGTRALGRKDAGRNFTGGGGNNGGSGNPGRQGHRVMDCGAKPKDLLMIPARVALALQADGYYLRSEIVWAKPNPMPESVRDRPTSAHEKVFLFAKAPRYYYDADAVRETAVMKPQRRGTIVSKLNADRRDGGAPIRPIRVEPARDRETRNVRNVWTITPRPFKGAHFAVFPPELPERCILAGSRPGGIVLDPFAGAGTVAVVARDLGRQSINIELNPAYLALARDRLEPPAFALAAE